MTEILSNLTTAHVDEDFDDFQVDRRVKDQDRRYRVVDPVAPLNAVFVTETGAVDSEMFCVAMKNFSVRSIDAWVFEHDGDSSRFSQGVGGAKLRPTLASVGTLQLQRLRKMGRVLPQVSAVTIGLRRSS